MKELKYNGSQYQIQNVARGEKTTIIYVYKNKTQYILKAPKKSDGLEYFGPGSGSWILEVDN